MFHHSSNSNEGSRNGGPQGPTADGLFIGQSPKGGLYAPIGKHQRCRSGEPIKLVIFDIAGTIIEDHGEVLSSFKLALKKNGISAEENELREWKGASKREVIRYFMGRQPGSCSVSVSERIDRTYKDFRETLEDQYQKQGVVPIEGAQRTFEWLLEHNICIATTTGFHREINDFILRAVGWQQILTNNVCSTDVTIGRPAPFMVFRAMEAAKVTDVAGVINVGDTPLDLQAGANAGVRGLIGVLTGTHTEDRLRRERHTHILPSVTDLPSVLQTDFRLG